MRKEPPPAKKEKRDRRRKKGEALRKKELAPQKQKEEQAKKPLIYDQARRALIKMENGLSTMHIASLNPDSIKTNRFSETPSRTWPEEIYA